MEIDVNLWGSIPNIAEISKSGLQILQKFINEVSFRTHLRDSFDYNNSYLGHY